MAWRFLAHLSENDLIDYLLHELPPSQHRSEGSLDVEAGDDNDCRGGNPHVVHRTDEQSPLLREQRFSPTKGTVPYIPSRQIQSPSLADGSSSPIENDLSSAFVGLNALEIAAVANAKKFFSQQVVQKVVNSIWSGDIVFWDSLNVHTKKKAQVYNQRYGHSSTVISSKFLLCL